jgi:hypothetical protein
MRTQKKTGKTETKPEESFLINDTIWVFSLQTGASYCFTNSDANPITRLCYILEKSPVM